MSRPRSTSTSNISVVCRDTSLRDLLTTRTSGLIEAETWAILCQSVQALQDLFLSDGLSGKQCIPLVTPSTLMLSSKGRIKLCVSSSFPNIGAPTHLSGYLAPEYKVNKTYSDTDFEKMWIFSLGETLNRAVRTNYTAISPLSNELRQVLADMTRIRITARASLMHLLDVMSEYCKKRKQNRPFSHIVMDLHQEALAGIETSLVTPLGPPAMAEMVPRLKNRSACLCDNFGSIPRRWPLSRSHNVTILKATQEVATSMDDLSIITMSDAPGTLIRPRSLCVPASWHCEHIENKFFHDLRPGFERFNNPKTDYYNSKAEEFEETSNIDTDLRSKRIRIRRNPVQRAASRLYRAGIDLPVNRAGPSNTCVGPEFVVRASLPTKKLLLPDLKGTKKVVTVIMLDGQKLDVTCTPSRTTAGQLLELIIRMEEIEENYLLGLSALIAGDFVFLPSDTRISKVMPSGSNSEVRLTLFLRIRFFLQSLRGIRGSQARHLLYLQLRRSILEHQLPCSFSQVIELNGLALQAEFGNYNETEHGCRDYFLLEHYVPETMTCIIDDQIRLREELIAAHISQQGLEREKAEQDFIIFTQNLPHYGGHFYTATWMLKDNNHKDIWLYISAQGINLYERGTATSHFGPQLYEMFEWKSIQTLCYSKYYLCILPHNGVRPRSKFKKYKLKLDYKKSYFAFRLASLHHQFFLRLRTEYTSLQTLSQQFGIPIKDIKNETNSLCKLDAFEQPMYFQQNKDANGTVKAATEFKIDFKMPITAYQREENVCYKRSKSFQDVNTALDETINEDFQNRKNENPVQTCEDGLVLDSLYFAGLPIWSTEKRKGVKMGIRAFSNLAPRVSRSMEAVNASVVHEYLEQMSLASVSLHCSSTSISKLSADGSQPCEEEAYVLDSTIKSISQQNFLPNFQETINETLLEKLNNMSFAEERVFSTVAIEKDSQGSLGLQITEGSDGNVYVQSVILGGPANLCQAIVSGDQIVAVNGHSLLGRKYIDSLKLLKNTGRKVEFILSRIATTFKEDVNRSPDKKTLDTISKDRPKNNSIISRTINNLDKINIINNTGREPAASDLCKSVVDSPIEKHLTESCCDLSNSKKYIFNNELPEKDVSPHRSTHHQYEPKDYDMHTKEFFTDRSENGSKDISMSLLKQPNNNDRAVIIDMIPKIVINRSKVKLETEVGSKKALSLEINKTVLQNCSKYLNTPLDGDNNQDNNYKNDNNVALPRSLGLSRKWKGPVRYPVTPIKKIVIANNDEEGVSTSDEEQIFI